MQNRVRTLTSHNVEESENSPESPHLGENKHMRKQCDPGASPFFTCTRDEARNNPIPAHKMSQTPIEQTCTRRFVKPPITVSSHSKLASTFVVPLSASGKFWKGSHQIVPLLPQMFLSSQQCWKHLHQSILWSRGWQQLLHCATHLLTAKEAIIQYVHIHNRWCRCVHFTQHIMHIYPCRTPFCGVASVCYWTKEDWSSSNWGHLRWVCLQVYWKCIISG